MVEFDGWEIIGGRLGQGGQGIVYKARSPQRMKELVPLAGQIERAIAQTINPDKDFIKFARDVVEAGWPDAPKYLGAVKRFIISQENEEDGAQAVARPESEVTALDKIKHPSVLRLLHQNVTQRFIVTEFHGLGTLDKSLSLYRGNALLALQAFQKLVDGVCAIHEAGAIHRDIKPENIFLSSTGDLVLGDFGIVFFSERNRLTTTFERVGTHRWMAPWAYDNVRLEFSQINPLLDIFPLGKVLWSMIAGKNGFPFWEIDRPTNNLEILFPDDPSMPLLNNELLKRCVVRDAADCGFKSALALSGKVNDVLGAIQNQSKYRRDGATIWSCQVCGKGKYRDDIGANYTVRGYRQGGPADQQNASFQVMVCDHCKHAELFLAGFGTS